jgi:putative oxidoreductase
MSTAMQRWRVGLQRATRGLGWLPLLVVRLCLGGLFVSTGWGKIHNLAKVTGFFTELGIPAPGVNAMLVGYSELICGALLLVGLLSRLATLPLITTMAVALATAKRSELHGITDLFGQVEFTYLCMLFVILVLGPGAVSVDGMIAGILDTSRRRLERREARDLEHAYVR